MPNDLPERHMRVYFDGSEWPEHIKLTDLAWDKAWIDPGPSPAGNAGPYLKVPYPKDDTVHRLYFELEPTAAPLVKQLCEALAWHAETPYGREEDKQAVALGEAWLAKQEGK